MIAVDTNVLVYRLDRSEPAKRAIAKRLLRQLAADGKTVLMWQVAGDFCGNFQHGGALAC
jgi:predicted nucleic acid-binding protein